MHAVQVNDVCYARVSVCLQSYSVVKTQMLAAAFVSSAGGFQSSELFCPPLIMEKEMRPLNESVH